MGMTLCTGAMMLCPFGLAPSTLNVLPDKMILSANKPMANIMDNKPMVNIPPFGMCTSLANPTVASATAAAAGVLTPMPCIPNTPAPWTPGNPMVLIKGMPSVNNSSKLTCMWAGVISVTFPGQVTVMV
ncbi:MAG: DUF4280 domain-containing protein [Epsilonproteobacteria bacterium]|nr:MAG: DUF4280 domain-containing protein [Campylobacterota bacterium]